MIARFLPFAGSEHAGAFDGVLTAVHIHMAIQAVAWSAFFLYCLIRFRRGANPRASHAGMHPALPLFAIAIVIVGDAALLARPAIPVWLKYSTVPEPMSDPLEIHVIGEQFAWNVHYPGPDGRFGRRVDALIDASNPLGIERDSADAQDDIGLQNILTVPVGRPVVIHVSSRDVVHSFTLNEMRVRQDATPGVVVRTWFTPTATGKWEIGCSQLCGLGHYRMRGAFSVLSVDEWSQWQQRELALIRRQ